MTSKVIVKIGVSALAILVIVAALFLSAVTGLAQSNSQNADESEADSPDPVKSGISTAPQGGDSSAEGGSGISVLPSGVKPPQDTPVGQLEKLKMDAPDSFYRPEDSMPVPSRFFSRKPQGAGNETGGQKTTPQARSKDSLQGKNTLEKLIPAQDPADAPRVTPSQSQSNQNNMIPISRSGIKRRGTRVNTEVPSVRTIVMAPASTKHGGDDTEILISPVFDVVIRMPTDIDYFRSSSQNLQISSVTGHPNMIVLKIAPVTNPTPVSMHIVDVNQLTWTFTVIGLPTDLDIEYPKTVLIKKKQSETSRIGPDNPSSILDAMDVDDAIQMVVGDLPKTSEFEVELVNGRFMHYRGYVMFGFRIFKKDRSTFDVADLKFTLWANDRRLDRGNLFGMSSNVEWTVNQLLSKRESRRRNYPVLRVFVQVKASVLEVEEWSKTFVTISDRLGYTRANFPPFIRQNRAPVEQNPWEVSTPSAGPGESDGQSFPGDEGVLGSGQGGEDDE